MTKSQILEIQIKSDWNSLRDDVNAGLYEQGNIEEYLKRVTQLKEKIEQLNEIEMFEKEQKLADLTQENQ